MSHPREGRGLLTTRLPCNNTPTPIEPPHHVFPPAACDACVDGCRSNRRVPEEIRHVLESKALLERVYGDGMPQGVGRDRGRQPGCLGVVLEELLDSEHGDPPLIGRLPTYEKEGPRSSRARRYRRSGPTRSAGSGHSLGSPPLTRWTRPPPGDVQVL
jgi:hypothetical protein